MPKVKPNQVLGGLVIVVGLWLVLETGTTNTTVGFPLVLVGGGLVLGKGAYLKVVDIVTDRGEDVDVDATPGDSGGGSDGGGSSDAQSDGEAVAEGQASN